MFKDPRTGRFAKAGENQAVVDKTQAAKNARRLERMKKAKARAKKKKARLARENRQKRAFREEGGLFKGLQALVNDNKSTKGEES